MRNPFRKGFFSDRTASDKMTNSPEFVVVGGERPEFYRVKIGGTHSDIKSKVLEIREPSYDTLKEHVALVLDGIIETIQNDPEWIGQAIKDPTSIDASAVRTRFGPVLLGCENLIAAIVGENSEWVTRNMSLVQITNVLATYARAVGLTVIRDFFAEAVGEFQILSKAVTPASSDTETESAPAATA